MSDDLRARILAADDLGREEVFVPEWDATVYVRGLTAGEVEELASATSSNGTMPDTMANVVVRGTLDADGDRLFLDEDVAAVSAKSPSAVKLVFDAIQRVSGLEAMAGPNE